MVFFYVLKSERKPFPISRFALVVTDGIRFVNECDAGRWLEAPAKERPSMVLAFIRSIKPIEV